MLQKPRFSSQPSRLTSCRAVSHQDRKPVFQFHENGGPVSFQEMKEAHDLVSGFPAEHRMDCYASLFNIDGAAMDKYYVTAKNFEKMYQQAVEVQRKKESIYIKLGCFHIYINRD